jgi:hypothetical protein
MKTCSSLTFRDWIASRKPGPVGTYADALYATHLARAYAIDQAHTYALRLADSVRSR